MKLGDADAAAWPRACVAFTPAMADGRTIGSCCQYVVIAGDWVDKASQHLWGRSAKLEFLPAYGVEKSRTEDPRSKLPS